MKILLAILFLFCSIVAGHNAVASQQFPWQLKRNEDGVKVFTRKVKGSPTLEHNATVVIDAPIDSIVELFEDDNKVPEWFYHGVKSDLVEEVSPQKKVYYFKANLNWPVADRDCVFQREKITDPKTGEIKYVLSALPDKLPKVQKTVRVRKLNALWVFTPQADSKTKVYFQQHVNPGGSIPGFMANALALDVPFYSLKNLRTLAQVKSGKNMNKSALLIQ
jgi:hypothetical protein